jgi:exopolysaccharide biosynthesis predicted pyruvyltransferase EpsI
MLVYHAYANKANIGDYYSALAIKRYIDKPMQNILVDRSYYNDYKRILRKLTKEDIIIVGGGGLLKNYFQKFWESLLNDYSGYKLILWGVGECINHFDESQKMPDIIYERIGEKAALISVRDMLTYDRFNKLGIKSILTGCPSTKIAISWEVKSKNFLLHIVHPELMKSNLGNWKRSCLEVARNLGLKYKENNHICRSQKILQIPCHKIIRYYYENSGIIVSSRLHGTIFGGAHNIPVIPVSNDYKIDSYWNGTLGGNLVVKNDDYDLLLDVINSKRYDNPLLIRKNSEIVVERNDQFSLLVNSIILNNNKNY